MTFTKSELQVMGFALTGISRSTGWSQREVDAAKSGQRKLEAVLAKLERSAASGRHTADTSDGAKPQSGTKSSGVGL